MEKHNALIELVVKLPDGPIKLAEPCMVTVSLINRHDSKLMINRRMAVGYEKNLSRELYVDILDRQTNKPAKIWDVDYHRNFPERKDYVYLETGDALTTTFNLFEWYLPASPGEYTLIVHYQADEELTDLPGDIVYGVFSSRPIALDIAETIVKK